MSKENQNVETTEIEVVEKKGVIAGFKEKHPVASKVITGVGIVVGVGLAALGIGKLVNRNSDDEFIDEDDYVDEDDFVDEDVE